MDLATMLQVTHKTIRRWIRSDNLPRPIQVGQAYRWRRDHVLQFLQEREADVTQPAV
jgi:predicted DNA-binding transcriptional regulator AlpA